LRLTRLVFPSFSEAVSACLNQDVTLPEITDGLAILFQSASIVMYCV
jgi:hypothetical protein